MVWGIFFYVIATIKEEMLIFQCITYQEIFKQACKANLNVLRKALALAVNEVTLQ